MNPSAHFPDAYDPQRSCDLKVNDQGIHPDVVRILPKLHSGRSFARLKKNPRKTTLGIAHAWVGRWNAHRRPEYRVSP
jgi:hypothetical protein